MKNYLRVGISALLLAIIAWRTDWSDVAARFAHLRLELWLAAAGLFAFAQVVSARRWQLYARELLFERTFPQYCTYYFIGMFFNLVLPSAVGGDVMRVVYLNGNAQRQWPAFMSVLLERLSGLGVLIALACVGVAIAPCELPLWVVVSVWGSAAATLAGLIALPILARWSSIPEQRREQIRTIDHLLRSPGLVLQSSLLSMLTQLSGVVLVWCLAIGLGLDIPLGYCCVLAPMVMLLTFLPISVNGMGVREGATVLFLTPLGIEPASAVTLAVLWFSVGAAISLVGGGVYLCGMGAETTQAYQPEV